MIAIVMAGGIPAPEDALYTESAGGPKALIDIAGKPMIQWILDALNGSNVEQIIIVGLNGSENLLSEKPVDYLKNQGSMLQNIVKGVQKALDLQPKTEHVLLVSSDIPAITPEMVDWLTDRVNETKPDILYGVISREEMESRYPESNRTYLRLKDMEVCGADINAIHVSMATEHLDLWEKLIGKRKSPFKQAATIGFLTLFLLFTRRLTLDKLVNRINKSIGIDARAILCPWAQAGMDVDKPHQLALMRTDLRESHE